MPITPMPLTQTNPCVNGMFNLTVASLFPPVPSGTVLTCTLAPHTFTMVTAEDGITMAQMDDVIGHITISQPKASSYTFWHNINWTSNVALNQGDKLALWVTYHDWNMTN